MRGWLARRWSRRQRRELSVAAADLRIPETLPTLQTARLILRPLRGGDAADLFAYAADPEVTRYLPWEPHRSVDDSRRFLEDVLERDRRRRPDTWGIVDRATGQVIGTIRLGEYSPAHARASVGYALGRPHWNRGLTTEALGAVLRFGFTEVGLHRIYAYCHVDNAASERVMQKAGMTYEGTLREAMRVKGGYESRKLYAILRSDWATRQGGAEGQGPQGR
ncbi:MAG TPA: GNAT family N-acetyltransferase [bacterium]|nr:GNAT family N-acetyltransferase [bacterium]